ncbi:MAG: SAM-dependent methyltransferase [Demequinaceae bacterium]|nr:SAM-dependent methyltransferase [Demequinaceae bacterium]
MDPVGHVIGPRTDPIDDGWGSVESVIRIEERFPLEAFRGLNEFSHIEVVFVFDKADPAKTCTGVRHPRGLAHLPEVGIFAQRNKDRPNHIGVSRCELLGIEGRDLRVRGLDAIDGSPVLDIKPFFSVFTQPHGTVREPAWVGEITRNYFK